jgi:hypothetical protein
MDMVWHQVPLHKFNSLLLAQLAYDLANRFTEFAV